MSDLLKTLLQAQSPLTLCGLADGFAPLLLADATRAAGQSGRRLVYIAPDEAAMAMIADAAQVFAPDIGILRFPAWDCLPYDRSSPSLHCSATRLATLSALQAPLPKSGQLVLTTVSAFTQRTITPFRVRQLSARLAPGTRMDRDRLAALLASQGYVRVDTVADYGEFAVRGGLVDLYPSGRDRALRLDFFGDELDSIREFDPADQRSIGRIDAFDLLPAAETLLDEDSIKRFRSGYRELFGANATSDPLYQAVSEGRRSAGMDHWLPLFEDKIALFSDHLASDSVYVAGDGTAAAFEARIEAIRDYHANRVSAQVRNANSYRPLGPDALYVTSDEWATLHTALPVHQASHFDEDERRADTLSFASRAARDFAPERKGHSPVYDIAIAHLKSQQREGRRSIFACYSEGSRNRLAALLADHGADRVFLANSWQEALGASALVANAKPSAMAPIAMLVLPIDHGFTTPDIALITEQDLLGDRLVRRAKKHKSADAFLNELATMAPGDLVVHRDHGIGRYDGLVSIPVGQSPHDCVALSYAGGDKLYVPVENLDILSRYGSDEGAALDRLGGEAWQRRKARMKERIREIAGDLMRVAAARALRQAPILVPDSSYGEFVAGFAYQETEDQDRAIADVTDDLAAGKPMDRLVCGDVGFGKTEVALRAAHIAAMAGMQVAILCPTTLLARQHAMTFADRFRPFPLKIGRLSRLVGAKEAADVKSGLASGGVDIVVGTHALLSKDIKFNRLGLVIIDEEQRFGVTHKERMKGLRADVHVLTLTATPIPRTLQMAMSGLRELSVIQTPPVDRLAVRTYIQPWDPVVLREALLREHYRGGQSFFVVPRISDLADIEEFLRTEVPEIRPVTAHGQMSAGEVEKRMSAFYDRQYDVLLSTTIVESGLDIPTANTMIVHHANRFGLAQLYQLRGRVGRSKTRAYAYFSTPESRILSENADKRLKIMADLDTLGAGFQLASHDLDIRGAGNLLGDEQSGHIREVGFELYQSMLEDAILAAKSGELDDDTMEDVALSPQISIDVPILIPENYVPDLAVRMGLYRRLNMLEQAQEVDGFAAEMIDRFGPLPEPAANLMTLIQIKQNAIVAGISKMDVGPKGALVSFRNDRFANIDGLLGYVARLAGTAKLRPDHKLVITRNWPDGKSRLHGALQLSKGVAKLII